jgi:hypothetical protein
LGLPQIRKKYPDQKNRSYSARPTHDFWMANMDNANFQTADCVATHSRQTSQGSALTACICHTTQ